MSYIGKSPIPVTVGGTGDTTLTAHGVLLGEGTAAISATTAGTAGQVLLSGGSSADPSYVTPTAGTGVTVVTTSGVLSYALTAFPLSVANGGTGATTLTANSLLLGNGTSAITALGAATNGQIPIGSTGAAPVLATITAGSGASVTNSFASITIAATGASGISTINGNSGSATGSPITVTTGTSNANGTAKFTGSSTTMTLAFSGSNGNLGLGASSLAAPSFSGSQNVCLGTASGSAITTGNNNTCIGYEAGHNITSGGNNTLVGTVAGASVVGGSGNCFFGYGAGELVGGNSNNTCIGYEAGQQVLGSTNTLVGYQSGINYTGSESSNVCINAGGTAGESNVLRIGAGTGTGTQQLNKSFIYGINGITVTGTAVLISSGNQLGVLSSSLHLKRSIQDMGDASQCMYDLRPVTFAWDKESAPGLSDASERKQFGLIAEEVAEIVPQLVSFEENGAPLNVDYTGLASLVLNEVQRLSQRVMHLRNEDKTCRT